MNLESVPILISGIEAEIAFGGGWGGSFEPYRATIIVRFASDNEGTRRILEKFNHLHEIEVIENFQSRGYGSVTFIYFDFLTEPMEQGTREEWLTGIAAEIEHLLL